MDDMNSLDSASPTAIADRVKALRAALRAAGLTGFIVPHADEHQSEYLPASAERLAWLTGFAGSAGMAIVLADSAAIFVDGRYTLQVRDQVDGTLFSYEHLVETPPAKWLAGRLKSGDRIGYDPWLMTIGEVRRFAAACRGANAECVPVAENPLDKVWSDRPAPPLGQVSVQPLDYAGEDARDKIARLQASLRDRKVDAVVLPQADSIAWTLNIRGADIAHNPVPLAFAILPANGKPSVFIDGRKLTNSVRAAIADLAEPKEPSALAGDLAALGASGAKVLLDPQTTADAIAGAIREAGGTIVEGPDPVALPKARKNATELDGARRAHLRDGVAMVRFLAWIDANAPDGGIDEIAAADRLEAFRADTARADGSELIDVSFDTISGAGPNGAIVHYRVSTATNRTLEPGSLYLVDSGAQYVDGTTDITRTVAMGDPSAEARACFTRVLQGMIAISRARWPKGLAGRDLDGFARYHLWLAGQDFDHGTGHGVGAYLSVHEGPVRLSRISEIPLEPGMILSNEPGYYREGAFGIRIENLVVVQVAPDLPGADDRAMYSFETLTFVPIDRRLIDAAMLSGPERDWLNAYHAEVLEKIGPRVGDAVRAWLEAATAPI
jgi:Xaa-Pro aminopeptidase